MRPSRTISRLLAALGAAAMSGCYSYVPVERPAPGSVVRIQVPVRAAVDRCQTGSPRPMSMEGTVLASADSLVLQVESRRELGAYRELKQVDTVRVAPRDLAGVDLRVFSKPKTILLTAGIVGVTAALAAVALDLGGGSQGKHSAGGWHRYRDHREADPVGAPAGRRTLKAGAPQGAARHHALPATLGRPSRLPADAACASPGAVLRSRPRDPTAGPDRPSTHRCHPS